VLDEVSKKRVKELCDQIAKEQDHKRFSVLISELNQVLDGMEPSLRRGEKSDGAARSGERGPSPSAAARFGASED